MKTMMTMCALLAATALAAQTGYQGRYEVQEPSRVATAALPTLRELAQQMPDVVGLSANEAGAATLGEPLPLFDVGLEALKGYRSGTDPRSLLQDVRTLHFPILVSGAVRSSIVVRQQGQGWLATDFGQAELAKRIGAARGTGGGDALLVRVPALNAYFVGTTSGGTLQLTPLADVDGTDYRALAPAPADAVFTALAARAQASNGLPT